MMLMLALNSILLQSIILLGLLLVAAKNNAKSCAKRCMSSSIS